MSKKAEPTPEARGFHAEAAEAYARHNAPETQLAAKEQQAGMREQAAANIGWRGTKP